MAFPVKWYSNAMQGAPSLGDTSAGALTALLKAVLVTGFGTLTLTSLVWDATEGAAKATIAAGHAYKQDSVIEVTGAIPADYNGEHRVKKVSTTEVWFELDGGNPGASASGTLTMKVAPLGWTLTHESADGMVAIYRPTDVSASGNVSLRVDNTAFSGWSGSNAYSSTQYLAKVALVEDVVDINTYTTIYEHRWPATQRYSTTKVWDLIGDPQLFYWLPAIGNTNYQAFYCFGYLKSIRPGDRYHAILQHYWTTSVTDVNSHWASRDGGAGVNNWGTTMSAFNDTSYRALARPYHQLFGTTGWWIKGLFTRFGQGMYVPNGADNGFYMSTDPIMVMENNNHLRGYLPGLICPFGDVAAWDRKNFANLPALPGKLVRFIRPLYQANVYNSDPRSLVGFDLTGPWR
ncbi:hypothetical protein [Aeromonas caviae]|uniref:hypothetical protein n=1 Tax=Aeromonas caviae TaxID=648 RepID=UPI003F743186